ncbi:hypothetical protein DRF67_12020 [Chryseobacterium pennipullorum]|uniref:Uncharacterized protein n=2 Tax=Chryseobacterium pennipullorum TaxID=2258963 RepID=A0A3D9B1B2_9FLAO|nr:hypothetical protein DRF67_12020 [Chryseobacterium pennipullorum]
MVLLTRESRPPPVFILFLKILYLDDKGFFFGFILKATTNPPTTQPPTTQPATNQPINQQRNNQQQRS